MQKFYTRSWVKWLAIDLLCLIVVFNGIVSAFVNGPSYPDYPTVPQVVTAVLVVCVVVVYLIQIVEGAIQLRLWFILRPSYPWWRRITRKTILILAMAFALANIVRACYLLRGLLLS